MAVKLALEAGVLCCCERALAAREPGRLLCAELRLLEAPLRGPELRALEAPLRALDFALPTLADDLPPELRDALPLACRPRRRLGTPVDAPFEADRLRLLALFDVARSLAAAMTTS